MNAKCAKRKATSALQEIIIAARRYIEAENELESQLRAEQTLKAGKRDKRSSPRGGQADER